MAAWPDRGAHRSAAGEELAASLLGLGISLAIVALLLAAYGLVKAVNLVIRACARHRSSRPLRAALATFTCLWALAGLTAVLAALDAGHTPALGYLAGTCAILGVLAAGALVLTAKIVELAHSDLVLRERSKEALISDVLQGPWWEAA